MNERIKLLAEQAGLNYHNWITNESNINDGNFKYPRLEDYEKFAELIIRECAAQVDNVYKQGGGTYSETILNHFGIKSI